MAVDAMRLTLGLKFGRVCRPYNNVARDSGVLWALWLKPSPGACPLSQLILISDRLDWSAQRRRVEAFHRRIKQQLGLAHLYSLQPVGIELQLEMAVLLVLLSCLILAVQPRRNLLELLDRALQGLRLSAGLSPTRWRPNTPPSTTTALE